MSEARLVDAGGVRLAVTERGAGAPVVVLHGFTGNAQSMEPAARALEDVFRTLSFDLVGHGASDAPTDVRRFEMDACCTQLGRALDALGIESAHWLGYSMGGRTALAMACLHPSRVRSLVLVGASAGLEDAESRAQRCAADEALAARIEAEGVEAFVDRWMALPLFASQKRLGDEVLAAARAQRLRNRPHALACSLRGMGTGAQPALHEQLGSVECPVLCVAGDEDAKFRAIADELAAALPRAEVAIVAESGHAAHLENPMDFGRLARAFFAKTEAEREHDGAYASGKAKEKRT